MMMFKGLEGLVLRYYCLKSRRANRLSLALLDNFFARAQKPEVIQMALGLKESELAVLEGLALKKDGWYPINELWPEREENQKGLLTGRRASFMRLVKNGLIMVRAWSKLVRLSDAGRFALILVSRPDRPL
jgi:hypothetical protein